MRSPPLNRKDIFSFLRLPGEIRNRIYELVALDEPTRLYRDISKTSTDQKYGILSHVSRKIRREYLPILRKTSCLSVNLALLNSLFEHFECPNMPFVRKLTISVEDGEELSIFDVDYTPVIRTETLFPHDFEVTLDRGYKREHGWFGSLCELVNNKWEFWFEYKQWPLYDMLDDEDDAELNLLSNHEFLRDFTQGKIEPIRWSGGVCLLQYRDDPRAGLDSRAGFYSHAEILPFEELKFISDILYLEG